MRASEAHSSFKVAAAAFHAQLGLLLSVVGAFDASLKIARLQRITEAPPEPSLCAWEVLLMPLMRSS